MFDTTQTVRASDVMPSAAEQQGDDSAASVLPVGAAPVAGAGDSSVSSVTALSGIDALIAARTNPGGLPVDARAAKAGNSKDAAADALKKFFGKR
jgi:hypothetical protein